MDEYGTPYEPTLRDMAIVFALGAWAALGVVALFVPGVFE